MKNTLKITFISFTALFLFACDSSTSTKKTDPGGGGGGNTTTYTVDVSVTGLDGTLNVVNGTDSTSFVTNDTITITTDLADLATYDVQVANGGHPSLQTCTVALGNGSIQAANAAVTINCVYGGNSNGIVTEGRNYYMTACQDCHKAGSEDPSKAFGSSMDLALNYQSRVNDRNNGNKVFNEDIKTDMHRIGELYNLMGNFDAVSAQTVADLQAYLDWLCVPQTARNPTCP